MPFLLKGIFLGFSIAAPVGPIGLLCIRRTLSGGISSGFVSGLGAATADAIYGAMAAFGLSVVTNFLLDHQRILQSGGGLFLLYLGVTTFRSLPAETAAPATGQGLLGAYVSTLLLTIANPMTILSFVAVFAGLGLGSADNNYMAAGSLIAGVFFGSVLWWLLLSGAVHCFRQRVEKRHLKRVNQLSGLLISGFGIYCLWLMLMPFRR
jgi:threonine/homoserine/homoserine lactone efflux protein